MYVRGPKGFQNQLQYFEFENITQSYSQITKDKNQDVKEELEAKYQLVTDSKCKIKSAVWRTIPQVSWDKLMVHYKFIRWQTI